MRAEVAQTPAASNSACAIAAPVRLSAWVSGKGQTILFPDQPIVECEFALVLSDYTRVLIAPLGAASMGAAVTSIHTGPGFECRGRNHASGGKISAHGKGLAVDITSIEFANKRQVRIDHQNDADEIAFFHAVRRAACGWFSTVLGPGADAYHDDNLHLDIEMHGSSSSYRICQ